MPYSIEHGISSQKRLYLKKIAELNNGRSIVRGNLIHLGSDKLLAIDEAGDATVHDIKTLTKTATTGNIKQLKGNVDFTRKRLIDIGELYFGVYYQNKIEIYAKSTQNKIKELLNVFVYDNYVDSDFNVSHMDDNAVYVIANNTGNFCCMEIDRTATIVNTFLINGSAIPDVSNSFISKDLEHLYVLEPYAIKIYSYKTKQLIKSINASSVKCMARFGISDVFIVYNSSSYATIHTFKKGFSDFVDWTKPVWDLFKPVMMKRIGFLKKNRTGFIGEYTCIEFYKARNSTLSTNTSSVPWLDKELTAIDNDRLCYTFGTTGANLVLYKTIEI